MAAFNPVDCILTKRDGHALSARTIDALIQAYTAETVPDYQMSAFLMAVYLNGMNAEESAALTRAMLHSGTVLDLSDIAGRKVDKHSTGGVGDKISLVLAPLVAACGVPVPMISGRSLGHSGGTLDKLEAIPGLRTNLDLETYCTQLDDLGLVMIGQTASIAPADRKLYALRDVTGTVESIPLISASIMSKKLAEGIDALVLDVKCGRGAFMQTEAEARTLAETLVRIAEAFGKPTVAWLTDMDAPLGYGVGNWPETAEAIRCLQGASIPQVTPLTCQLAGEMLHLGGVEASPAAGFVRAKTVLQSGAAFDLFAEMVERQGGDPSVLDQPELREGAAPVGEVTAPQEVAPYVATLDARAIGQVATRMGAGRTRKEEVVDPTAGITLLKKPGDAVQPGEPLARLHTRKVEALPDFEQAVLAAFSFSDDPPTPRPLLMDRYTVRGWKQK